MHDLNAIVRRHPLGAAALAGLALLAVPATLLPRPGGRPERPEPAISAPSGAQESGAREFLAAVRGANPVVCELTVRSLGNRWGWMDGEDTPSSLASADEARRVVAWVDSELGEADVAPLSAGLADPDACVRRTAARLLGRVKSGRATEALLEALRSGDRGRQEAAMLGLAHKEDPRSVEPLVRLLGGSDTELRVGAAWTLGHVGSRDAVQPLLGAARDGDARVRRASARALGRLEDPNAVPALAQLLASDGDPTVRRAAAWALGRIE